MTSPSPEMTEGYIQTLLSFQIHLISRAKFLYFVILTASVFWKVTGQKNCYVYYKCCFILSINEYCNNNNNNDNYNNFGKY